MWKGRKEDYYQHKYVVSYSMVNRKMKIWSPWILGKWNSVCVINFQKESKTYTYSNGDLVAIHETDLRIFQWEKNFILLGSEDIENNTYVFSTFGAITDFNIWKRALKKDEVLDWSLMKRDFDEKVFDWNKANFYTKGIHIYDIGYDRIMEETDISIKNFTLYNSFVERTFSAGKWFCEDIGAGIET